MSSTPPSRPLELSERPSSPALASPRQSPPPSFNPFAPILPPRGTRAPLVRLRKDQLAPAAREVSSSDNDVDNKTHGYTGELVKDDDFSSLGDPDEAYNSSSAFMPSVRRTDRRRPVVRQGYQARRKDDPATVALGQDFGDLELSRNEEFTLETPGTAAAALKEVAETASVTMEDVVDSEPAPEILSASIGAQQSPGDVQMRKITAVQPSSAMVQEPREQLLDD